MAGKKDDNKTKRMKELIGELREASKAYYQDAAEIMSNKTYDAMYDELLDLEKESGVVLSGSPTQNVGYEVLSELPKEEHASPMLSLDKTKNVDELVTWMGDQKALLSWKLDGLTIVLTYAAGKLVKAVTRGNGYVGEVITGNAKQFENIPLSIKYQGDLVLRGEAVIKYSDFERLNDTISEADAKYKNPRNLCSGSVRQLDPKITKERHVYMYAFTLVSAPGVDFHNSREYQYDWLSEQGFDVVEHVMVTGKTLPDEVAEYAKKIENFDVPSDGLVLLLEDIAYGESLGMTSKFPRNSIAFKWTDETKETTLKYIEWSPARTGVITPVAVFEPVELEGTTVSRASVHNISIMKELALGEGDKITVYKANMIIPQIAENLTRSDSVKIPDVCQVCGGKTKIKKDSDTETLICTNPDCQVKKVKSYALLSSRDAMNIDGLSEMTLEKFISAGFIKDYADIFRLDRYKEEITHMEGFGEKSYENLMEATKKAELTTVTKFIYSLGIPGIGLANAKVLSKFYDHSFDKFRNADIETLTQIDGIGEVLADAITDYFDDDENNRQVDDLLSVVSFEAESESSEEQNLSGMTFVITGSVEHFANRKELQTLIEAHGGKATGTVTSKTTYLINNDVTSTSGKNKKAKELGVKIISEENFLKMIEE